MHIAISRQASECVRPTSSRFALDGPDRLYSIVACVDIYASRPNCSFATSVMYHNNAMTINKYVEAEQRTSPAARYKEGCFLLDPSDIKMES